ncbi:MAG: PEP-CTERM sorting domain-containing protein [Nitrospiraceae bacterium]|nr:PEP-CTERM sorting domain-containing protein [Nitrospiraceae bacterium]
MKKFFVVMVSFVFVLLAQAQFAHATPTLVLYDTATGATGTGISNPNGTAFFDGNIGGNWTVVLTTGSTYTALGSATDPNMDLSVTSAKYTGTAPTTLDILFYDNGYTYSGGFTSTAKVTDFADMALGSYVDFSTGYTSTPGLPPTGVTVIDTTGNLYAPIIPDTTVSGIGTLVPTDYFGELDQIYAAGPSYAASLDYHTEVPEPGTFLLLGLGLLAFAIVGSKLAKQNA